MYIQAYIKKIKYTKKNLTGESIEDLTCLCNSCHYKAEYIYRGKKRSAEKRSLEAANKYIEDRASGKKSLRKKRKKKKSRRQKGTGSKYLDICTVCGIKQHTTRLEWHRAAPPRCVACGGMLERSWDTYLKKQNDQRVEVAVNTISKNKLYLLDARSLSSIISTFLVCTHRSVRENCKRRRLIII